MMSEFTKVDIRRGTDGLGRSKGFWSGKDILLNNDDSTIYVLAEKATTQHLLNIIGGIIDTEIRNWVMQDVQKNMGVVQAGKHNKLFFRLEDAPSLRRREWRYGKGASLVQMMKCWQEQGKTTDELCEFLSDEWVAAWRHDANIYPCMHYGVPEEIPLARLLLVRWDKLDGSIPLVVFLQRLWDLAGVDMTAPRFLGEGGKQPRLFTRENPYRTALDALRADELELLKHFGFGAYNNDDDAQIKLIRRLTAAPLVANYAITMLTEKGVLLPPRNLGGEPVRVLRELGRLEPYDRFFRFGYERRGFGRLLISSTIRELEDIPADLKNQWDKGYHRAIKRMLIQYGEEKSLPPFDVTQFERGNELYIEDERKKWRPQWFRDNGYSDSWCQFADAAFHSSQAGNNGIAQQLKALCHWALERFESPWDITPLHLINPHTPKSPDTFSAHCKNNDSMDSARAWWLASTVFNRVENLASIPGYPWYREGVSNPFQRLECPFKRNQNRSQKTHRSRIATLIHEKMIEILLDVDEDGRPTFNWARTQFSLEDDDDRGVWCPSRWTALAVLLLLPLRKKQVRWLDQGLMDEKVFDPETFQVIDNTHSLRDYTYEDGRTHLQRYGRPSGVIQQMTDEFMGTCAHVGLFVNTNKTQLWNTSKRNGYELPWPDGGELVAAGDPELQQHGYWLRRIYEVLAYQYRHVMKHDPNPEPATFVDVIKDRNLVSVDRDCVDRMPHFVPLFRDTANKKQVERDGRKRLIALPVSNSKLQKAYVALCIETEARLKAEGFHSVSLTMPNTSKGATEVGLGSRKPKFDIHCLRVAGISRLIEMGIDPVIVQEFVAGHLTPVMTHHYLKMQPWHVREKIIEAIVNGDFKSAMETFAEKVAKGEWDREKTFVGLPRFQDHVANLPEDFACFSAVKGGICIMGGKGDACNDGGVYEHQSDGKDAVEVEFGPVQGGCGNCIYFRTAAFLIMEQTLVLNILLAELRAQARERKKLRTKISDLTCKIDQVEGSTEKNRLISDKILHEARIEELNQDMVPRLTEWVNRYIMLQECEGQLDELQKGTADTTTLVAPFGENIGLTADDLKVDQEMAPDIGLIGRIVEGSRVLGTRGIVVPENQARFLERGVDKLLRMSGSQHLLLDIPDSERTHGASMMFNALEDLVGAEIIQQALDNETPLALSEATQENINQFVGVLVSAAKKGNLTIDNILVEGKSHNMINDTKVGIEQWAK